MIIHLACGKTTKDVIFKLEKTFCKLFKWFLLNHLKLNDDKSHLLVFNVSSNVTINIGSNIILCSATEKLLGILGIDNKLRFDEG